jgi:hypothetical protein
MCLKGAFLLEVFPMKPVKLNLQNSRGDVHTRDNMLHILTRRHFNPILHNKIYRSTSMCISRSTQITFYLRIKWMQSPKEI